MLPQGSGVRDGRIVQIAAILTVLSLAPGLLVMVTSFTRFAVALSFLRSGVGLQSTPANIVLISLALFMTFFVMSPVFERAWNDGLRPLMDNEITEKDAFAEDHDAVPRVHARTGARQGSRSVRRTGAAGMRNENRRANTDLRVLVPAFMISELRRGFEIGFLIILPFLVIDMIVSTLVMSMGMMMLPPSVIALAVEGALLRADRWLEPGDRFAREVFWLIR